MPPGAWHLRPHLHPRRRERTARCRRAGRPYRKFRMRRRHLLRGPVPPPHPRKHHHPTTHQPRQHPPKDQRSFLPASGRHLPLRLSQNPKPPEVITPTRTMTGVRPATKTPLPWMKSRPWTGILLPGRFLSGWILPIPVLTGQAPPTRVRRCTPRRMRPPQPGERLNLAVPCLRGPSLRVPEPTCTLTRGRVRLSKHPEYGWWARPAT